MVTFQQNFNCENVFFLILFNKTFLKTIFDILQETLKLKLNKEEGVALW
jgi:hypothetical protein